MKYYFIEDIYEFRIVCKSRIKFLNGRQKSESFSRSGVDKPSRHGQLFVSNIFESSSFSSGSGAQTRGITDTFCATMWNSTTTTRTGLEQCGGTATKKQGRTNRKLTGNTCYRHHWTQKTRPTSECFTM